VDVALKVATTGEPSSKFNCWRLSRETRAIIVISDPTSKMTSAIASWELIEVMTPTNRFSALVTMEEEVKGGE
tara:strand:+ start:1049 stop:1267 length:219 start_codon:yes stop_codon:yes gene_type:complete